MSYATLLKLYFSGDDGLDVSWYPSCDGHKTRNPRLAKAAISDTHFGSQPESRQRRSDKSSCSSR